MSERPDYAEMNQLLYTGKAKEINALTDKYIHEWKRPVKEVLEEGLIAGMTNANLRPVISQRIA